MKHRIVFTLIMSFFLSSLMSLWVSFLNLGLSEAFLSQWGRAFSLAWPAAAVIAFFFGPLSQKITARLLD